MFKVIIKKLGKRGNFEEFKREIKKKEEIKKKNKKNNKYFLWKITLILSKSHS